MSALTGVSSSGSVSYATQLAQTSSFERSLYNLGTAVQNGNLTAAGSILTALMKANPQYATASSAGDASSSQDSINQDFQALTNAISNNQTDVAQTAWTQLKGDLAQKGISQITDGTTLAAQAVAENKAAMDQALLSNLFGTASDSSPSVITLLGGGSNPSSSSDSVNGVLSNWLTYEASGSASAPATTAAAGTSLDTIA
jgi:hypothetical protein